MKQVCGNCRYYMTPKCWEKKESGRHPDPDDWCAGWKQLKAVERNFMAYHEDREDAARTAAEVRRERREGKG